MHTLFSANIRSPPPALRQNPFEARSDAVAPSSSNHSSQRPSPDNFLWTGTDRDVLTRYLQGLHEAEPSPHHRQDVKVQHNSVRSAKSGSPKLVLMGQKRSGKSSIASVVFHKLPPAETFYIESTSKVQTLSMQSFMDFEVHELPSNTDLESHDSELHTLFKNTGAVIWVIDVQDEYFTSLRQLISTSVYLAQHHPAISFEVFIHKVDGLSDEYRYDTFREVRQRVQDELSDLGYGERGVAFYQTSIYDHSIFDAMSKVIQKLIPQLPALETLLNKLCSSCRIEKAYLFDTVSKIYIATDTAPTSLRHYEACSDYVDVIVDIKEIYGWQQRLDNGNASDEEHGDGIGESLISFDKTGDTYMFAREIDEHLSLICVMATGSSVDKRVLIDYNVSLLQEALLKIFNA